MRSKVMLLMAIIVAATVTRSSAQNQFLHLLVDPANGLTEIQNPALGSTVTFDGYQITSASGSLVPDPSNLPLSKWDSLASQGLPGWDPVQPSTSNLSELNLTSSVTLTPGQTLSLGYAFNTTGTEDLLWGYSVPPRDYDYPTPVVYGTVQTLFAEMINTVAANGSILSSNMVLINPSSTAVSLDAYQITSASGSLNTAGFKGFASQGASGWESVGPSSHALSELNLTSSSTLNPGQIEVLGTAFKAGSAQDLALQFHQVGTSATQIGSVFYQTQLAGDLNHDGIVNSQDLAVVSSNWLQASMLSGDANYDGIVNSQDLAVISSNWLASLPGGAQSNGQLAPVPEPGTLALMALGLAVCASRFRNLRRDST